MPGRRKYVHLGVSELRRRRAARLLRPGKHLENVLNVLIESFAGRLRDRCLTLHQFASLAEAQGII